MTIKKLLNEILQKTGATFVCVENAPREDHPPPRRLLCREVDNAEAVAREVLGASRVQVVLSKDHSTLVQARVDERWATASEWATIFAALSGIVPVDPVYVEASWWRTEVRTLGLTPVTPLDQPAPTITGFTHDLVREGRLVLASNPSRPPSRKTWTPIMPMSMVMLDVPPTSPSRASRRRAARRARAAARRIARWDRWAAAHPKQSSKCSRPRAPIVPPRRQKKPTFSLFAVPGRTTCDPVYPIVDWFRPMTPPMELPRLLQRDVLAEPIELPVGKRADDGFFMPRTEDEEESWRRRRAAVIARRRPFAMTDELELHRMQGLPPELLFESPPCPGVAALGNDVPLPPVSERIARMITGDGPLKVVDQPTTEAGLAARPVTTLEAAMRPWVEAHRALTVWLASPTERLRLHPTRGPVILRDVSRLSVLAHDENGQAVEASVTDAHAWPRAEAYRPSIWTWPKPEDHPEFPPRELDVDAATAPDAGDDDGR